MIDEYDKLLKEAIAILHCHQRELHRGWLMRARELRRKKAKNDANITCPTWSKRDE